MTTKVLVAKKAIKEKLSHVMDPEMNLSIVDIGLIYKITVSKTGSVHILMTLTSIGCPLFGVIEEDMHIKLAELGLTRKKIKIEITFDPPWEISRLSPRAKATLGI